MSQRPVRLAAIAILLALASVPSSGQEPEGDPDADPVRLRATPAAPEVPAAADPYRPGGQDYRIGRQDLLELRVFGLDELDQVVRVSDDGSITLPLLGRLSVVGLTKGELEDRIAALLGERYVRDPQVVLFIRERESKKVAITGAVREPGTYEMLGEKTLLEMLSAAGGLDRDFGQEIIVLRTGVDGTRRKIPVDLQRLVYDVDPELNITIEPGDMVYVPILEKVRIFVGGAVKNPNLYEIPRDEPVTVLKAITLAGGTTDRAAEKKVQIHRTDDDGTRVTFMVNLRAIKRGREQDPVLQADDVVFVQEAFF